MIRVIIITMKTMTQTQIAKDSGVSPGFISLCMSGNKRPSWGTAKKIAAATGTDPIVWLEGTPEEIRTAIKKAAAQPDPLP